jgi:hypothetical protein
MMVFAMTVTLVETLPALFEPLIFQPLMSTGLPHGLYNSTNSSEAPDGPRKQNSLMTTLIEGAALTGCGVRRQFKNY